MTILGCLSNDVNIVHSEANGKFSLEIFWVISEGEEERVATTLAGDRNEPLSSE